MEAVEVIRKDNKEKVWMVDGEGIPPLPQPLYNCLYSEYFSNTFSNLKQMNVNV